MTGPMRFSAGTSGPSAPESRGMKLDMVEGSKAENDCSRVGVMLGHAE